MEAFNKIIAHENNFNDIVLEYLNNAIKDQKKLDPSLIYLAAYLRDERYIPILVNLINDKNYSYDNCIYSCPIVFALTIYEEFTNYELVNLDSSISPVQDFITECEKVRRLNLISDDVRKYIKGPGVDDAIEKGLKLDISELIEIAGPFRREDDLPRFVAAVILEYRLIDPKHLPALYWLAISEEIDSSLQYRTSIYFAIYKTEKYKFMN